MPRSACRKPTLLCARSRAENTCTAKQPGRRARGRERLRKQSGSGSWLLAQPEALTLRNHLHALPSTQHPASHLNVIATQATSNQLPAHPSLPSCTLHLAPPPGTASPARSERCETRGCRCACTPPNLQLMCSTAQRARWAAGPRWATQRDRGLMCSLDLPAPPATCDTQSQAPLVMPVAQPSPAQPSPASPALQS